MSGEELPDGAGPVGAAKTWLCSRGWKPLEGLRKAVLCFDLYAQFAALGAHINYFIQSYKTPCKVCAVPTGQHYTAFSKITQAKCASQEDNLSKPRLCPLPQKWHL